MKIALLGVGVVGGGVLDIVDRRDDMELKYVLVRRDKPELGSRAVKDIDVILNDNEVDTVVEVMGGLSPAYEYVSAAMKAGKNVVTANKHLVAHYYKELVSLAKEMGVAFRCTPAVGGGIPWLKNLERAARLDRIDSFCGIMNGTTNFILDNMHVNGSDFGEVLAEAQRLGYAEADPTADIDGLDIQRKCIISANVAFGACFSEEDVPVFGIRSIKACDIEAAVSMNRVCRILAFGKDCGGRVSAYVEPVFVASGELEAAVSKAMNIISFVTGLSGKESFYGQGAGRYPTAYNVVQDCVDVMQGVKSFYTDKMEDMKPDNSAEKHPYYVRFAGSDEWLESMTLEVCGDGAVICDVSVADMHAWAAKAKEVDPALFFAGIV
ncbi:MAG: homoserine dehydrogenase [Oscillospiraceae bacterium]|nr:homoserine dehydrogenase [Oscillospiraceae bacterium]